MPNSIKNGEDGQDYESCLTSLEDKGDARFGICMKAYEAHHEQNDEGKWIRKKGHIKNDKGDWIVKKNSNHAEFTGLDDWVPIFRGGEQVDSQGNKHDGDALIEKAIASFDPQYHEPPAVVGHPKDNSPAFGWVEGLKAEVQKIKESPVKILFAKFKQIVPEFAQAVRNGVYKKRSASFYADGRLRHVGFLGGMPPAVKGLADLKFEEGKEFIEFLEIEPLDFSSSWIFRTLGRMFQRVREWIIESKGIEEADKVMSLYDIENINDEAARIEREAKEAEVSAVNQYNEGGVEMPYSEEQLQAQLKAERERLTAEFAERDQKTKEAIDAAQKKETEFSELLKKAEKAGEDKATALFAEKEVSWKKEAHKKEITEFVQSSIKLGQILPAWEKMGLASFMEQLANSDQIDFAEGKKETPYQWFRSFLLELPKTVNFGEFAHRGKEVGKGATAGEQLDILTQKRLTDAKAAGRNIDYSVAFAEIQQENQDLTKEYIQEIG